jgi:hypothetical protein
MEQFHSFQLKKRIINSIFFLFNLVKVDINKTIYRFVAPEQNQNNINSFNDEQLTKADVFSIAHLIFTLVCKQSPNINVKKKL